MLPQHTLLRKLYGCAVYLENSLDPLTLRLLCSVTVNLPSLSFTMGIIMPGQNILISYHFIRYKIKAGAIKLVYCSTNDMTADTLTKALPPIKAKHFASALGLCTV